jgi:hypothetical protein
VSGEWEAEYKAKLRKFMEDKGAKVEINEDAEYEWDEVSPYGWSDYDAVDHTRPAQGRWPGDGCHWVVPEGATLTERTYSMFDGTFTDNKDEVGINVHPAHCACGKYTDVTLRYVGSLGDVIRELTGVPKYPTIEL